MAKLIGALFPEGQRKVMVNLVILAVGIALDKLGGGLTDQMQNFLLLIAAVFTGGNVAGKLIPAILDLLRGTKVGQIVEDVIPGDQGLGEKVEAAHAAAAQAQGAVNAVAQAADQRLAEVEKKMSIQAQNTAQIVQLLNTMRGAPNAGAPGPARPAGQ